MSKAKAIVFDLGETLVDETRMWEIIAHQAGISLFTLAGVLGGLIERHLPFEAVFKELGIAPIEASDFGYRLETRDFYPDAIPVLRQLQELGYRIGVAANQPPGVVEQLAGLELPLELNASSATLGIAKPDPRFFEQIVSRLCVPADAIVYVGDRLDNDVLPAQALGMHPVFIKRGPWGYIHATWPQIRRVRNQIMSLHELPAILERINDRG